MKGGREVFVSRDPDKACGVSEKGKEREGRSLPLGTRVVSGLVYVVVQSFAPQGPQGMIRYCFKGRFSITYLISYEQFEASGGSRAVGLAISSMRIVARYS